MAVTAPGRLQPTTRLAPTLVLASLGFVSLGLPEGMLGVAWPSIRATFDLPLDALGLLIATFAAGYFVSSAISGRVIGRFGVGGVLAASCCLTGVCLLGYAVAPSWSGMVVLAAFLGLGAGTIDGGLNTYAAIAHGPRTLNWMHAAFGLGAAVGPLIMTLILSSGLAWNAGYAVVAVAQLGLAVGYWLTRRRYTSGPDAVSEEQTPCRTTPDSSLADGTPYAGGPDAVSAERPPHRAAGSGARLVRLPLIWLSLGLFFVYVGMEAGAGQWSFSLFTLSREMPAALAGALVSAYWASLTIGRVLFGALVPRLGAQRLLRACMLACVLAAGLLWANIPVVSWLALAVLGLAFAPIFPVLIAETPARFGQAQAADAIGWQVAAAVVGGATLPALLGVMSTRWSLEVVGPTLVAAGLVQLGLYAALTRKAASSETAQARLRATTK
ncbi:MAG: MFS transporter [Chloroflexi bacterium]|nr:MFS transporter [Chloroflexota bacterium]